MTDPWQELRRHTRARIALGRAGHGLPTSALLEFQLAHALARDAVQLPWDAEAFARDARAAGLETVTLSTAASDRIQYLKRPDLGRVLAPESRRSLESRGDLAYDVALILTNGLSSTAAEVHGHALLSSIAAAYDERQLRLAPICLVENARVALSDQIGAMLNARLSVIIVGERPGLSAADSLGIYMTYRPQAGNTDAERNCISNIRPPDGLSYRAATEKLLYLSLQAMRLQLSGVGLKDEMAGHRLPGANAP